MKLTRISLIATMLFLGTQVVAKAQTYYHLYLCDNATATLRTPEESTLTNGDKVHWYKDGVEVAGSPFTYSGPNSTNLIVPTSLAVGAHSYTSAIESAGGCLGDPSDPFSIFKLPTKTLALSNPTNATYCGDNSNAVVTSQITATATPAVALPDGIEYNYIWSVTKDGVAVNPLSAVGADNGSTTNENVFTMNTTGAGTYVFSAQVKYVKSAANTGVLRAGDNDGCNVSTTSSQTVVVTPKPGKPSIELIN